VNLNKVALYLEYLAFMLRKSTNGKKALAKIMGRVMQASVKVMRSYDYCHFEVALSREVPVVVRPHYFHACLHYSPHDLGQSLLAICGFTEHKRQVLQVKGDFVKIHHLDSSAVNPP
jgi:hypothetical protein